MRISDWSSDVCSSVLNLRSYRVNKSRMLRVATYSRACLEELRRDTGIAYEERCRGTLQMFRDQKGLDDAAKDIEILKDFGVEHSLLDRAGCIVQEPADRKSTRLNSSH